MRRSLQGNLEKRDIKDAVEKVIDAINTIGGELYDSAFPSFENEDLKQLFKGAFFIEVRERLNRDYVTIATPISENKEEDM